MFQEIYACLVLNMASEICRLKIELLSIKKQHAWCFCKRKKFRNITLSVKELSWNTTGCKSFSCPTFMQLSHRIHGTQLTCQKLESCEAE